MPYHPVFSFHSTMHNRPTDSTNVRPNAKYNNKRERTKLVCFFSELFILSAYYELGKMLASTVPCNKWCRCLGPVEAFAS